jgi:hypothetical protein
VKHRATRHFWQHYNALPPEVRRVADAGYQLLKSDSRHPSLQFKKVGRFWSVRVGLHYRALAVEQESDLIWFWIGNHSDYERNIAKS